MPDIAKAPQDRKQATAGGCLDETYIKVKGKWMYLYRAVDKYLSRALLRNGPAEQRGKRLISCSQSAEARPLPDCFSGMQLKQMA